MFNNSMSSEPIFVTILCLTYNHESYIRQCLDGFVMQQTNFRFEAIVHDDASTDSTTDIIREYAEKYPDIIKPIYETENQYSKHDGSLRRIMTAAVHGKYIALCEGDDYWTDPLKLQKQVDILENNDNCSLVISNGIIRNERTSINRVINPLGRIQTGFVDDSILLKESGGLIPTCSMMYRSSDINMPEFFHQAPVGDRPLRMWLILRGKSFYFNEAMVTYRAQSIGSFTQRVHHSLEYAQNILNGMNRFFDDYNEFTHYKYFTEIQYMKDREYYLYLIRIGSYKCCLNTPFYKSMDFLKRIRIFFSLTYKQMKLKR